MRGIFPQASLGLRDSRILRYAGSSAGADMKRNESAAAMEVLVTDGSALISRGEAVDDDVHQPVMTDLVSRLTEGIPASRQRITRARDSRNDLHLLPGG